MLEVIDIHDNQINSPIPPELGNLKRLIYLDLSFNLLNGMIPTTLAKLKNLAQLYLQRNFFNGSIPSEVGELKSLTHLDLSLNNFCGKIPHELGSLVMLTYLNLQNNSLQGTVPEFQMLLKLNYINLAYNHLTGNIPNNLAHVRYGFFLGNEGLKEIELSKRISRKLMTVALTPNMSRELMAIVIPPMAIEFIFYLVLCSCCILRRRTMRKQLETVEKNGDFLSIWNYDGRIAYEDIINATEGFDIKYCIGTGGYGSVYKAQLPNKKIVALKKLHRFEAEDPSFDQSFKNEVKHLTEVRHRSIIKLHGFCLHRQCMFLVYEYMERGSLFCALRDDVEAVELDWPKRLNIVWDMAHALSYLHHDCAKTIVHRDISSNNILLDNKFQAFLSDFGLARLLEPNFSSNLTSNIVGTPGYIAPGEQQSLILF
ncbi:MDIS1-interacting receptor like kinase 2-like [Eucalyptus grandis]|uniref:MDIS1-interacting receptor like kinase 2-like n=1 Tax=Eucalyptus grandis TaxID=71139 RepID=UPI00192EBEC4|nr:MDIS1-interacting receptor like kinase 2-like [Eucalyptus grandis]